MGDRTHVTLTLTQAGAAEFRRQPWYDEPSTSSDQVPITTALQKRSLSVPSEPYVDLEYDEVNYGELPFLTKLEEHGIAYDSRWENGGEYGPGIRYCRFHPSGEKETVEYADINENPPLTELMDFIRHGNTEDLVEYIKAHHLSITPLPWDHQDEYGKIQRARNLISQKE